MTFPPPPADKQNLEEGPAFTPKFDARADRLRDPEASTGEILMLAYMNALALEKTLETGIVHYWSRSRNELWRKGDTSGQVQKVIDIRVDCDQDALLLRVEAGGDGKACHTGRKSCFDRQVEVTPEGARLRFVADEGL